jgi:hypothetical protein
MNNKRKLEVKKMEEGTAAKRCIGRPKNFVDEVVSDGKEEGAVKVNEVNAMVRVPENQKKVDTHYDDTLKKKAEPRNEDIIKWDDQER